ncbi:sensor histidine kinase [Methylorubrum zatmanii]
MPAATTTDTDPLGAEAARALEAIGDPVIVADRSGTVAYANDPARALLPRPPPDDPSRTRLTGRITTAFLAQVSAARTPLAGVIALGKEEEHHFRCHGCRMDREGADPLVLLRVLPSQDTRFSLLANEAVMLRRELAERERYQRRLHMLLCERDLLLADLRNTARARTRAERDRDAVLAQLYRAHQAERERLGRELHDEAGQQLAWLKLRLDRLRRDPSSAEVDAMLTQVDAISASLRQVVRELRPVALAELGLSLALSGLVREWSDQSGVAIEFQLSGTTVALTTEIEVTIFRLVQEALTNVAKHAAGAQQVSVTLQYGGEAIILAIEDDGPGLTRDGAPEDRREGGGFGLTGMRERLALLGGDLTIESSSGRGTTILARLPTRGE